jgi:hypothetical protein
MYIYVCVRAYGAMAVLLIILVSYSCYLYLRAC